MMLRIEAGDSSKRLDLKSVREETGLPVSTWTRITCRRTARLRVSRAYILTFGLVALPHREGQPAPTVQA